jgi:hypothetical protein
MRSARSKVVDFFKSAGNDLLRRSEVGTPQVIGQSGVAEFLPIRVHSIGESVREQSQHIATTEVLDESAQAAAQTLSSKLLSAKAIVSEKTEVESGFGNQIAQLAA